MEENYETILTGYPTIVSFDCTKSIINQMEKNICKIKIGAEQGTGFFCQIPFPDKNNMMKVLITNNHLINEDILYKKDAKIPIYIKEAKEIKVLNLNNRIRYTKSKKEYDITIIEIKEEDGINNFLELDDKIVNDIIGNGNENVEYIDKTFYIIQYPEGDLSVSYGVILSIFEDKKYKFNHKCSTKEGSSGSPILTLKNKVIGLHTGGNKINNLGTFLNEPIKDFIKEYKYKKDNNKIVKSEISKINEKINNISVSENLLGLLKLCLLKAIFSKLSDVNIKKLPNLNCFIMESLKNINIKYIIEKDTKEEILEILQKTKGNNIINFSNFVDETLDIKQINELINLLNSEDSKKINELKLSLSKYSEHIKLFYESFEKAKKESIFEFSMISLVIKERGDLNPNFENERKKCPNRVDKLLFHGTGIYPISSILTGFFKKSHYWETHPKGVYFTDFLDYCWFFCNEDGNRINYNKIPKVGENLNLIACSVYYNKEKVFVIKDRTYHPKKNGICINYTDALNEIIINPDFSKFVGIDYNIFDFDQIFPFVGVKLERNEYCIIWRDDNFSTLNNNFFNKIIRNNIQLVKYNLYKCENSKEALKLLERKKYNKIILISNIGLDLGGKKFVDSARKILANDIIVLFVSSDIMHLKWIIHYKNALFVNDFKFIEEYLKSFEDNCGNIEDKIKYLIEKIEKLYKVKFNFDDNFLKYPLFKEKGKYSDLSFNI